MVQSLESRLDKLEGQLTVIQNQLTAMQGFMMQCYGFLIKGNNNIAAEESSGVGRSTDSRSGG